MTWMFSNKTKTSINLASSSSIKGIDFSVACLLCRRTPSVDDAIIAFILDDFSTDPELLLWGDHFRLQFRSFEF